MATADNALQNMIANLEKNTGKSLPAWVALAKKAGAKHGEVVKALKDQHGLTHGYANLVAHEALQSGAMHQDAGDLVAAQYSGTKAALKPWYEALMAQVQKFGADVEVSPKKAYVSLRRSK